MPVLFLPSAAFWCHPFSAVLPFLQRQWIGCHQPTQHPLPARWIPFHFSNSYSKLCAVRREREEQVDRWRGLEGLKTAVPQPQESCNSRASAMAQLLEPGWRCWKEELTCSVDGLAKLAPSRAAFPSQISFLTPSCYQVGLALGISVWAELRETIWRTMEWGIIQTHPRFCRVWHRVSLPRSNSFSKSGRQMEAPHDGVGQCHQTALKGVFVLQHQTLTTSITKSFLTSSLSKSMSQFH